MAATTGETAIDLGTQSMPETDNGRTAPIIKVDSIWKVFGRNPEQVLAPENIAKSKSEIQSDSGRRYRPS